MICYIGLLNDAGALGISSSLMSRVQKYALARINTIF